MSTCIECIEPVSRPAVRGPGASLRTAPAVPRTRRVTPPARPAVVRPAASRTDAAAALPDAVSRGGVLVAPTVVPEHHTEDLLGLPDIAWLRNGLRKVWARLVAEVAAASALDGRIRERRDEDSAAMLRAGVAPTRFV